VFCVTAMVVLFNAIYSWWCLQRRPTRMREDTLQEEQ